MISRLTPHYIDLVYEAALKSFWRKETLKRFLRACGIAGNLGISSDSQTKRELLSDFFHRLETHPKREEVFARLGKALMEQSSFPDLEGWEDSKEKKSAAVKAVNDLKLYVEVQDRQVQDQRQKAEARKRHEEFQRKAQKTRVHLEELADRLNKQLTPLLGTQDGGYQFQDWFYDLMEHFDVVSRRPYSVGGRQIDGSITLKDTTYLVELKFTATQSAAPDIDSFIHKVTTKADNTMGVFVSMSGYSSVALSEVSHARNPVLLLDFSHVYHVLGGQMSFPDLIDRIKRHASQTGEGYLPISRFGG